MPRRPRSDDVAYVIGGRGATLGTPTDRDRRDRRRAQARARRGRAPSARSDLRRRRRSARASSSCGGRTPAGTTVAIVSLRPTRVAPRRDAHDRTHERLRARRREQIAHGAARTRSQLIYVPNSQSNTVDVIDPHTYKIVEHFAVGGLPQHVMPSWDLKTLYVTERPRATA